MDGENHGKTPIKMDDLGGEYSKTPPIFGSTPMCFRVETRDNPFKNRFANHKTQEFQKRLHIFLGK